MSDMSAAVLETWRRALEIWQSGGWAMYAIAAVAMLLFALGMHIYLRLAAEQFTKVKEKTWRKWLDHPEQREGPVGELLDFVTGTKSLKDTAFFFEELRATEVAPFERDLKIMKICVSAAPLVGLLGTVTGMLSTFAALSSGSGGDKTMAMVASGISEALVTTETGLVIAIPGLFFQYQMGRMLDRFKAFLAHLETACTQHIHRSRSMNRAMSAYLASGDMAGAVRHVRNQMISAAMATTRPA